MTFDIGNWQPLSIAQVSELFSDLDIPWWIAGGWAIDLFVGHETRSHGDTDVLIRRDDQLWVQAHLADWELFKTKQPGLKLWPTGEFLQRPVNGIWCRQLSDAPWSLELMLLDTDRDQWVFRRDPAIHGPLDALGRRTPDGIPYLAPEIQLLYKAKIKTLTKDQSDFDMTVPLLDQTARAWLQRCLERRFPQGHSWIESLRAAR